MSFSLLAFKSDALAADITDSANSMTLTTGSFGTPTGEQMLVIDYNIAAKREIVKCAIDGTAVTSIDRAQDGTAAVAHTSGAKIIMAFVPSHYTGLTDGTALTAGAITDTKLATKVKAGWDLLSATGTRASATQFTVTGDITDRLWVGKPLELTDTTTKYFNVTSFSYSSPNTTINFTGGTDYVLEGNPTDIYGGLHSSPVGFPYWFAYAPVINGSGGSIGTFAVNQAHNRFSITGRMVNIQSENRISNKGSWSGDLQISMPTTMSANYQTNVSYLNLFVTANSTVPCAASKAIAQVPAASATYLKFVSSLDAAALQWAAVAANDVIHGDFSYEI